MDRRIVLSVAGSGKTTYLINKLDLEHRFLMVTYTDNNYAHLRKSIVGRFGYEPANITLLTYFQFLWQVCYRPFLKDIVKAKGITFKMPDPNTHRLARKNPLFYMTKGGYLYHNRIAKLCLDLCADLIRARLEKFYDCFMIDEVQDLGGHDFNMIQAIMPISKDCIMVGDFYQHTFDTSNDGIINTSLYDNYREYKKRWSDIGVTVDEQTLSNSYRCSPTTCQFIQQNLGIQISSQRLDPTNVHIVTDEETANYLYQDDMMVKLFYNNSDKYSCFSSNWGASKGQDHFHDVCIILNKTTLNAYLKGKLSTLPSATKNKLYVACTRARGDIYLIPHTLIDKYKQ